MTVGEELQIEIIEVAISMLLIVSWNIVFFPSILLAAQLTMQGSLFVQLVKFTLTDLLLVQFLKLAHWKKKDNIYYNCKLVRGRKGIPEASDRRYKSIILHFPLFLFSFFFFLEKRTLKAQKPQTYYLYFENFQLSIWVHKNRIKEDNEVFVFVRCWFT